MSVAKLRYLLAIVSLLLFLFSFHPSRLEYQLRKNQFRENIGGLVLESYPQKISIPQVLEVEVEPAVQIGSKFLTPEDKASYFINSAFPGSQGNTIIYGHNKKGVFKELHQLQGEELIMLTDQAGKKTSYQVKEIITVDPSQTGYLAATEEDILTLYTCTGWADSKRLVIKAETVSLPDKNSI